MITAFSYTQSKFEIQLTVDSNAYPLNIVIMCFKTQPPPPKLVPCFSTNRVILQRDITNFATGQQSQAQSIFYLNQVIVVEFISLIKIETYRDPQDDSKQRMMYIEVTDSRGDQSNATIDLENN
jgi:hypothetical protein